MSCGQGGPERLQAAAESADEPARRALQSPAVAVLVCACAHVSFKFCSALSIAATSHSYLHGRQILKAYKHENTDDLKIQAVLHKIWELRREWAEVTHSVHMPCVVPLLVRQLSSCSERRRPDRYRSQKKRLEVRTAENAKPSSESSVDVFAVGSAVSDTASLSAFQQSGLQPRRCSNKGYPVSNRSAALVGEFSCASC